MPATNEGRKISKKKLNKYLDQEKKRNEEPPEVGSGIGFAPKSSQQPVSKSLLKLMAVNKNNNIIGNSKKQRQKQVGEKILTKRDQEISRSGRNVGSYTHSLVKRAMDDSTKQKEKQKLVEHKQRIRDKQRVPKDPKRVDKIANLWKEYRQMKKERINEKKKIKRKLKKLKGVPLDKSDESDEDATTGHDEVQFGEVVHRPPSLSGAKFFEKKLRKHHMLAQN